MSASRFGPGVALMGHRRRVFGETLDPTETFGEGEHPEVRDEGGGRLDAAGEFGTHHPPEVSHLPVGDRVVRVRFQPRIVDAFDRLVAGKQRGDGGRVPAVTLQPRRERLDPPEHEETLERAGNPGPGVLVEGDLLREVVAVVHGYR